MSFPFYMYLFTVFPCGNFQSVGAYRTLKVALFSIPFLKQQSDFHRHTSIADSAGPCHGYTWHLFRLDALLNDVPDHRLSRCTGIHRRTAGYIPPIVFP